MHNLTAVIERVKAAPWYVKPEGGIINRHGSVIVGMELHDTANGKVSLDCSIFYEGVLAVGENFEIAFNDLERQLDVRKPVTGEVIATV